MDKTILSKLMRLCFVLILVGFSLNAFAQPKKPLYLGAMVCMSGPGRGWSIGQKIAIDLARDDVNAAGGINGYPLKVIYEDVGRSAEEAVRATRTLIERNKVLGLLGLNYSQQVIAPAPIMVKLECPALVLGTSHTDLVKPYQPWVKRTAGMTYEGNRKIFRDFKKQFPRVKKVVFIVGSDQPYMINQVREIWDKMVVEEGFIKIAEIGILFNTQDMSSYVTKTKGLNPDALLITHSADDISRFVKECEKQGFRVPVIASAHSCSGAAEHLYGNIVDKWGWMSPGSLWFRKPKNAHIWKRFESIYKKEIPEAVPWATYCDGIMYDSTNLFAKAMIAAGVTPDMSASEARVKIKDALNKIYSAKKYSGVIQDYEFDPVSGEAPMIWDTAIMRNGQWTAYE